LPEAYKPDKSTMDIVFFFSGGASSMHAVLESPEHGRIYRVAGAVTNRPEREAARGWDIARQHGIEPLYVSPGKFSTREDFYSYVADAVDEMRPDVIGLSGFLRKYSIISEPFLGRYRNRIFNVHPADLAIVYYPERRKPIELGRDGIEKTKKHLGKMEWRHARRFIDSGFERLYSGDDAVTMAVLFGENELRSTVHVVEEKVDGGKILVRSQPKEVDAAYVERMLSRNAYSRIAHYASCLQDEMKRDCDGPAFIKSLELKAAGRLDIKDNFVTLDGEPLPYGGYLM